MIKQIYEYEKAASKSLVTTKFDFTLDILIGEKVDVPKGEQKEILSKLKDIITETGLGQFHISETIGAFIKDQ